MNIPVCGIYCITNELTNEEYIGQSVNIYGRWAVHRSSLQNGLGINSLLRESCRIHGLHHFYLTILEECSPEQLDCRELFYICARRPALNCVIPSYQDLDAGLLSRMHASNSPEVRRRQAEKLAQLQAKPKCPCGKPRIAGELYCGHCRLVKIRQMSREGYLVRVD